MTLVERATVVAEAEDGLATLNRVISLLRARRFVVMGLSAMPVADSRFMCLTIVVERRQAARLAACLENVGELSDVRVLDTDSGASGVRLDVSHGAGRP
jgi:acetolactate synthase regulatory subunit